MTQGKRWLSGSCAVQRARNEPYHPRWLNEVGGKELIAEYEGTAFPIADMDDPITLQRHLDFIKRLGERYDGHPDIAHVDIGSIGWWGEWHLSGSQKNKMPSLENRTKVIDAYLAAFKKTPLLMLIGGGQCLKYAAERGAGGVPTASATWADSPGLGTTCWTVIRSRSRKAASRTRGRPPPSPGRPAGTCGSG